MANIDYNKRIEKLQQRRFDPDLQRSLVTESFKIREIPENIKYLVESMLPIEPSYNKKTLEASERIKSHLESGLNLHFSRAYRTQGSVMTNTNIKVHSDLDLLTIIDRYYYHVPEIPSNNPYKDSDPDEDIQKLRNQSISILKTKYDEVDDSGSKCIRILNKSLNRKVDVVCCFWYNTLEFEKNWDEVFRGVYLYDFHQKVKDKTDYPFAHISSVNRKGDITRDGARKVIRLLKTLKADADTELKLTSFQLTTLVYNIENHLLYYNKGDELLLLQNAFNELKKIINDDSYRKSLKSPNNMERPFYDDETVKDLIILKSDIETLIQDCSKEIFRPYINSKIREYR